MASYQPSSRLCCATTRSPTPISCQVRGSLGEDRAGGEPASFPLVPLAGGAGGLSGRPLFYRSTVVLARVHELVRGRVALIGIGGIDAGAAAIAKIEAGASLLQLYTGLVFHGPGLLARIKRDLVAYAERNNLARITDATGTQAKAWAAKSVDGA